MAQTQILMPQPDAFCEHTMLRPVPLLHLQRSPDPLLVSRGPRRGEKGGEKGEGKEKGGEEQRRK